MKYLYLNAALILFTFSLSAQSTITGKVLNSQQQPLEFVNVLLLNAADSSLVKGNVTDANGLYLLKNIAANDYLLSVMMIGYQKQYFAINVNPEQGNLTQKNITLLEEAEDLETAVVTAKRPLYEQKLDRLVVNVKNSVTSTGSNALEVLAKSPGIRIDGINNEIMMEGSPGVAIEINGKRSRMSGDALIQLLQSMPTDNIERIELISTPPASYDAEGTGGIINIVLVKNLDEGVNGNVTLNAGYGLRPKFGASANLNMRKGKFNIYTDVSNNSNFVQEDVTISKAIQHEGTLFETSTYSSRPAYRGFNNAQFGVDYELSKQTTLGVLLSGYTSLWTLDASTETTVLANGNLFENSELSSLEENNWRHWMGNINLRHTFSNKGKLSLDYDYLDYWNENPTDYTDIVTNVDNGTVQTEEFISQKDNPIHFHVFKLDYKKPLAEKWNIEIGAKGTFSNFMNDNKVADIVNGEAINRPTFTNIISMDENIYAAYASTDWQFNEKTSAKLGVRYEYTDVTLGNTIETLTQRNYGRWFPSAFLSHNFDENKSIQLSYSERIRRPSLNVLAPAFFFFSPNVILAGNPQIRATITRQFRAAYRYKILMFTLQMSDDDRPMSWGQPTIVSEENLTITKPETMQDSKRAVFFVGFPLKFTKWWESRYELGVAWQQQDPIYEGEVVTQRSVYSGFNANQSFKLPKEWIIEVDGYLMTGMNYGLASQPLRGSFNIGVKKTFKNSSLTFNLQDVFNLGTFWENNFDRPELNLVYRQRYEQEGNVFRLTYSYNFGNQKMKQRERSNGASSEERGRVQ